MSKMLFYTSGESKTDHASNVGRWRRRRSQTYFAANCFVADGWVKNRVLTNDGWDTLIGSGRRLELTFCWLDWRRLSEMDLPRFDIDFDRRRAVERFFFMSIVINSQMGVYVLFNILSTIVFFFCVVLYDLSFVFLACAACNQLIHSGQVLLALDAQWHIWCFKCTTCSSVLHGEYMAKLV